SLYLRFSVIRFYLLLRRHGQTMNVAVGADELRKHPTVGDLQPCPVGVPSKGHHRARGRKTADDGGVGAGAAANVDTGVRDNLNPICQRWLGLKDDGGSVHDKGL